ncbi:helix-turn-helix domain-containing protein [Pandoraea anapnoica]|uniref:Helix-turn-helix domain-containing protein n=1 Tax=Pandoraea anapnoica TaxID=2508301 RepID=A0A5E5A9X9_9BURK|nr:helix-turn-helix domain-containing protein [Pandoraea anapnoica]VVE68890.1 helix-turn-helix domain-containing protein [Pandoraea anapnoica]
MSAHRVHQAWGVELRHTEKIVLLALSHHAVMSTGESSPKVSRLARDCGLSESAVRESIRALETAGHIVTMPVRRGVTLYRVKVEALA